MKRSPSRTLAGKLSFYFCLTLLIVGVLGRDDSVLFPTYFLIFLMFVALLVNLLNMKKLQLIIQCKGVHEFGESFNVSASLRNTGEFPRFMLRVFGTEVQKTYSLSELQGEERLDFSMEIVSFKRSLRNDFDIYLESAFPFSMFSSKLKAEVLGHAFILPKRWEDLNLVSGFIDHFYMMNLSTVAGGDERELATVREFQTGDPLNSIHWKASTKSHQWIAKQFETLNETEAKLFYRVLGENEESFEESLSLLRYCLEELLARGLSFHFDFLGRYTLLLNSPQIPNELLQDLASISFEEAKRSSSEHSMIGMDFVIVDTFEDKSDFVYSTVLSPKSVSIKGQEVSQELQYA